MIGSHPLICKNEEEEDDDDGDSVSSKLDLHFSKDDVIDDDDDDFGNFDSLKPRDKNYSKPTFLMLIAISRSQCILIKYFLRKWVYLSLNISKM